MHWSSISLLLSESETLDHIFEDWIQKKFYQVMKRTYFQAQITHHECKTEGQAHFHTPVFIRVAINNYILVVFNMNWIVIFVTVVVVLAIIVINYYFVKNIVIRSVRRLYFHSIFLFVFWFVNSVTQKFINGFRLNFLEGLEVVQGTIDQFLEDICRTQTSANIQGCNNSLHPFAAIRRHWRPPLFLPDSAVRCQWCLNKKV